MANEYISGFKVTVLILGMLIVSVFLGLMIGTMTFDWWYELMFGGPKGAVVLGLIVLIVAFLVPFFSTLLAQVCIFLFIIRSKK